MANPSHTFSKQHGLTTIAGISQRTLRGTILSLGTTFDISEWKQANSGENTVRNQCYFQALANFPHMFNQQNSLTTREYTSQRTFRDIISSRTDKFWCFPTQTSKFNGVCMAKNTVFSLPRIENWLYCSYWYINRRGKKRRIFRYLVCQSRRCIDGERIF